MLYAQKSEIINPSGFTHNYVVSSLKYVEDRKDTARLRYIACLSIHSTTNTEEMSLLDFMRVKAKQLGADCYYLVSRSETENTCDVTVRLFFGGEKFLKDNVRKQFLNRIIIFNETRMAGDTAMFYLNGQKETFDPQRIYIKDLALKESCVIGVNRDILTTTKIEFKKHKKARFFILPENKHTIVIGQPRYAGIIVNGLRISIRKNSFYEMSYDAGRFWWDYYK